MSPLDYISIGIVVGLWLFLLVALIVAPLLMEDPHKHRRRSWWQ